MLEFVLELILQLFGETLIDLVLHAVGGSRRAGRTAVRMVLYSAFGAVIGAVSLLLFPAHFIRTAALRLTSLVAVPVLAGICFAAIGQRRQRKSKNVSALESFWPAFSFALAMAAVRYFGAD